MVNHFTRRRLLPAAALLCLFSGKVNAAGPQPQAVNYQSLQEVLRAAYTGSPYLQSAREQLHGTHELLPQAQAGWKPTVAASGNITNARLLGDNFGANGTTSKEIALNLSQPIYRGGRTVSATDSAHATIDAQGALLNDVEQQFLLQTAVAYMDVMRDNALTGLARQNQAVIGKQFEAAQARFQQGDATATDVAQGQSRLAAAAARITETDTGRQADNAVFLRLTGMRPGLLAYPDPHFTFPPTMDAAVAQARGENPAVIASQFRHTAAQADIDTVLGELLPNLALIGSFDKQYDPQPGIEPRAFDRTIELTATLPLYEGGATRSRVRQAKHFANQRYLDSLEAQREAEQEAISAWEHRAAAQATITARSMEVSAQGRAREGVRQESALGTRTVLDALDADQEYFDAQTALVVARHDDVVAQFELARALGMLTPATLGFADAAEDHGKHLQNVENKILGMDVQLEKGTD